uniref:Uncharacterized protein n=1 Tax=Leersia perrieri TaxID=77586 RepID=A0A0D9V8P9_9ORYZ
MSHDLEFFNLGQKLSLGSLCF